MARVNLKKSDGRTVLLQTMLNEETGQPLVAADGQEYHTSVDLFAAFPELGVADQLPVCCKLVLHFHPGPGCILIEDAEEYRARYTALLRYGAEHPGHTPSTADFGPFDVSEIGGPQMAQSTLVFYAEDSLYSVPYRVEASWPPSSKEPVRFLLLPLQM
jgi:hypothetical protein